jgi:outer membrane protein assembly factor BamA
VPDGARSWVAVPRFARRAILVGVGVGVCVASPATGQSRGLIIRGLSFSGNRAIDDNTLRISIATSQSTFFARSPLVRWLGLGEKKYFNEIEFRRDVLRLTALYRQGGFVDATVDTVVRRTDRDVDVRFTIFEGEPIRVSSLQVNGVDEFVPAGALSAALPLRVGDPFNRLLMLASADTVRGRLADRGYPFAEVYRNFDVDRVARTAAIEFDVDPGMRATVGDVEVVGAGRLDDRVIRRTLSVRPGQVFRQRDLYQSQLDLYRTGLFNYANVALVDTLGTAAADSQVDVRVRVLEGPRQRVRLGGGYGTIDCFRTLASWMLLDFLGGGRSLELKGRLSQIGTGDPLGGGFENSVCPALSDEDVSRLKLNYNVTMAFRQPYVFSRRTSATLALFAERYTEFQAYLRQAVGGDLGFTYRARPDLPITVSYGLSYGSTEADPANFCTFLNVCLVEDTIFTRKLRRATLSLAAVRDHRNSVLNPSSGSWLAGEVRFSAPVIGSDTLMQFTRGTLEFAAYRRVGRQSVISVRAKLGTVLPAELGPTGGELRYVPTEERFYAGGASTVRGYGQNELGPQVRVLDTVITRQEQQNGQPVTVVDSVIRTSPAGGNDLLLANVEFRFPMPGFGGKLSGALYVDAGRVFSRGSETPGPSGLRVTPGLGVRITSPLGPIRFDVGFNPYAVDESPLYQKQNGELELVIDPYRPSRSFLGRFRLHFSVGQPF